MNAEELKALIARATELYQAGFETGHRLGQSTGYREGYAEAMKRAHEMVERTLGPLTERPEPN
jgi:flagellar biosynthesis/type III secretory pathway protein FliH